MSLTQTIILALAITLPFAAFVFLATFAEKKVTSLQTYFLGPGLSSVGFLANLSTSMAGLANIMFVFATWGFLYGFTGFFWGVVFWSAGLIFFRHLLSKEGLKRFVNEQGTLHEFLGDSFGSQTLRQISSIISLISFLIVIGFEIYIGAQIFQVFVPAETIGPGGISTDWLVLGSAAGIALFVAVYVARGGYPAVVLTDLVQGAFLLAALLLLLPTASTAIFGELRESTFERALFFDGSPSFLIFFIAANFIGWVSWFPVTMDMWQRCAATRSTEIPRREILRSILAFILITGVAVGIGINIAQESSDGSFSNYPLIDFLRAELSTAVGVTGILPLAIILAGFIGAMLSTIDTFSLAGVQTLFSDIKLSKQYDRLSDIPKSEGLKYLVSAKWHSFFLPILAFSAIAAVHYLEFDPVAVFIIGYSIQLSLFPPVVFSLYGRLAPKGFAIGGIVLGSIITLLFGLYAAVGLRDNPGDPFAWNLLYSTQVMGLVISGVVYGTGLMMSSKRRS